MLMRMCAHTQRQQTRYSIHSNPVGIAPEWTPWTVWHVFKALTVQYSRWFLCVVVLNQRCRLCPRHDGFLSHPPPPRLAHTQVPRELSVQLQHLTPLCVTHERDNRWKRREIECEVKFEREENVRKSGDSRAI